MLIKKPCQVSPISWCWCLLTFLIQVTVVKVHATGSSFPLGHTTVVFFPNVYEHRLHICMCTLYMPSAHTGQKKVHNSLEPELQRSCATTWMLGTELASSGRATSALLTIEPSLQAHGQCFFINSNWFFFSFLCSTCSLIFFPATLWLTEPEVLAAN